MYRVCSSEGAEHLLLEHQYLLCLKLLNPKLKILQIFEFSEMI